MPHPTAPPGIDSTCRAIAEAMAVPFVASAQALPAHASTGVPAATSSFLVRRGHTASLLVDHHATTCTREPRTA